MPIPVDQEHYEKVKKINQDLAKQKMTDLPDEKMADTGTDKPAGELHADMWVHRSAKMKCNTCMFWVKKHSDMGARIGKIPLGRCRKAAPTLNGWPAVYAEDWCGDHKLDEEKI